ncbi:DUF448 domain-containing protein [Croceicoccus mobilis]|uniref:YlxR domain-containing protein n=1 Tax=Croceicoccus mobilis TaxID=1703339 RepID=A0A916Z0I3_9SPHN|nr:DUF448 domain-containing protein [Croceicoccus mobilis]GGD69652.1 hypothetical protein GCM10010990_18970 [Croceicoccus mobilis]
MRTPSNETVSSDIDEQVPEFDEGTVTRRSGARGDGPMRKCVLTGRIAPRDTLLRLAVGPGADGKPVVLPDALAKAPGRGAWIGVSRGELEEAIDKGHLRNALARGFKSAPPAIPADLPDLCEDALTRAFTARLGIEYRGGNVLAGSDRIAEAARMGKVRWLAHASDAGADGSRKLDQAWRVGEDKEGTGAAGDSLPLDRDALSVALGRDNVVHLALTDRAAAGRVTALLARLNRYLGHDPGAEGPADQRASEP